jgi:hypothetical protein
MSVGRPDDLNYVGVLRDDGENNEKFIWELSQFNG